MRKFEVSCIDNKTGYQMILSECTYNMACGWLDHELRSKYDMEIVRCEYNYTRDMHVLWTSDEEGVPGRRYFYDEQRGYLLGE